MLSGQIRSNICAPDREGLSLAGGRRGHRLTSACEKDLVTGASAEHGRGRLDDVFRFLFGDAVTSGASLELEGLALPEPDNS